MKQARLAQCRGEGSFAVQQKMDAESPTELEKGLYAELAELRANPGAYAAWIRANRQNLYKGNELELLKDDLKTKVLLATHDGRKACLAAITALDKARAMKAYEQRAGLAHVAEQSSANMTAGKGQTACTLPLLEALQKQGKVASTTKVEFKTDRIILFGPDLYTARNIVAAALINDGVPDARARNALLSNDYSFVGCSVRKHPTQEYCAVIVLSSLWEGN